MSKILAVDYGRKRIGLALSDDTEFIAFTINPLSEPTPIRLFNALVKKITEINPSALVIGYPLGIDLKPTQMSIEVDEFISRLTEHTKAEIIKWNEVGTSKLAQKNIKNSRNKSIDSESARIILQEFLDFKKTK